MPTPNKYHSSGRLYTSNELASRKSTFQYVVRSGHHSKPYNLGIKRANRFAELLGHKFNKADYIYNLRH